MTGRCSLDLAEHTRVLGDAHAKQFLRSPVFVKNVIRVLPQFFHVSANKHLAELDKVAVLFIVHFYDTPRVFTTTDLTAVRRLDDMVGTDDSKGNLARNLLCLGQRFLVLIFISGCLENLNLVVGNVSKNLEQACQNGFRRVIGLHVLGP